MPYRAQRPSLSGSVGGPRDLSGPQVDYGAVIDSLMGGASSLIRNAYLTRQQKAQLQREEEDRAYTRQRDAEDRDFKRQEFEHRQKVDNAKLLAEGYHDEPHTRTVPTGMISRAMAGPGQGVQEGLHADTTVTQSDPHFDLERNIDYRTTTDRARITAEGAAERAQTAATERGRLQAERLQQQRANIEFLAKSRADLARWRQANPTRSGAIGRSMTGNQLNTFNVGIARGMLELNGGDVNRVIEDFRATPDDQRPEGMTEDHILAAYGQHTKGAVGQTLGLVRSLDMGVDEATAKRDSVVRSLTPPRGAAATRDARGYVSPARARGAVTAPAPAPRTDTARARPAAPAPAARADTAPSQTRVTDPAVRARALMQEGKSRAEILQIMQAEGYKVIDSGQRR